MKIKWVKRKGENKAKRQISIDNKGNYNYRTKRETQGKRK
jgi:hypothetical protein